MINAWKGPGIAGPLWEERDDRCGIVNVGVRRSITEGNFPFCRRHRTSQPFCNRAVCTVGGHEPPATNLPTCLRLYDPVLLRWFAIPNRNLFVKNPHACVARTFAQKGVECVARIDGERFVQLQMKVLA